MNIYEGIEKEFDFLTKTYNAEIRAIKSNPNTPAEIVIDYKDVTVSIIKSTDGYFLSIWKNHKIAFQGEVMTQTFTWSKVLAELDNWLPIIPQTVLF